MTYVNLGEDLVLSPPLPGAPFYSLYTGCEAGLCRSVNNGLTWSAIEGIPRPEVLAAATDGERSILYMGTPGGLVNTAGAEMSMGRTSTVDRVGIVGGGVFRLTTHIDSIKIFLPIFLGELTP